MSWDTAKAAVDYILSHENDENFAVESVVFEFIGGEPLLEVDLIDKICDYLKMQMYLLNHHWFNSYRFSFTTNGLNYDSDKVQKFIKKNINHLSVTITIDGTQTKHDINRIWKRSKEDEARAAAGLPVIERGSYQQVVRNIPLWLKQFESAATKVTISSPDIPYICESVMHLFSLGIHTIYINCVFENVWQEGDDTLFEEQLMLLADRMLESNMYKEYECSLFQRGIGRPMDSKKEDKNWCGAGRMLSIDASGNFYPCTRFVQYSLREKKTRVIGNIHDGIIQNIVRPFHSLTRTVQSPKECIECEVASGCAWCQGENYDAADSPTIFQRSTAICKMHKARVRANNYYWAKVDEKEGRQPEPIPEVNNTCPISKEVENPSEMTVLLSDNSTSFCIKGNNGKSSKLMPLETLQKAFDLAKKQNIQLQLVYPKEVLPKEYAELISQVPHQAITPVGCEKEGGAIVINGWGEASAAKTNGAFYILRTTLSDFYNRVGEIGGLLDAATRLNIVFVDEQDFVKADGLKYKQALETLRDMVLNVWSKGKQIMVNLITERLFLDEMNNCNAGCKSVTLAPNGKFYICPSFYNENAADSCGDIENGVDIKNPLLYKLDHSPLCSDCKAFHCRRCVFLNKKKTLEVNVPSYEQCEKTKIELEITKSFFELWKTIK